MEEEKNSAPASAVEQEMSRQDAECRAAADQYIDEHGEEDAEARSGMKTQERRNAFKAIFKDYIFLPTSKFMRNIVEKAEGLSSEKHKDEKEAAEQASEGGSLTGGAHTEGEKKVKGFNKKHIIIVGSILTVLIVCGVALGTGSSRKAKKEDNTSDRGAITGMHMNTMPKDYAELAALKKKQQAEEERLKEEAKAKRDKGKAKADSTPVSKQVRSENSNSHNTVSSPQKDPEAEARAAAILEARAQRKAAMSSPIGFDIKRK